MKSITQVQRRERDPVHSDTVLHFETITEHVVELCTKKMM